MDETALFTSLFRKNLPLFTALGDEARQQLLILMMDGRQRSVRELAEATDLSRPTVSHHLKILKNADLITEQTEGRKTYYQPQVGRHYTYLKQLIDAIETHIVTKKEIS